MGAGAGAAAGAGDLAGRYSAPFWPQAASTPVIRRSVKIRMAFGFGMDREKRPAMLAELRP